MPNTINYILNNIKEITVYGKSESLILDLNIFKMALEITNKKMNTLKETSSDLFEMLGMRNLSAFVGEMFVSALVQSSNQILTKNPHQDGYPDLLIMTKEGKKLWEKLANNKQDKSPFSNFDTGGIEVKATVGSVPTPEFFRKKGLKKPEIGDERIEFTKGYDWKAHHRETNNLLGIYWDFVKKNLLFVVYFIVEILQRVIGEKLFTLKRVEEELPVFQFLHEQEFTKCMKIGLLSLMTQDMSIFLTDIIEQT